MKPRLWLLLAVLVAMPAAVGARCLALERTIAIYPECHAMSGRVTWLIAYNPTLSEKTLRYRSPDFFTTHWITTRVLGGQRVAVQVSNHVYWAPGFVLEVDAQGLVITVTSWNAAYDQPFSVPVFDVCRHPDIYAR